MNEQYSNTSPIAWLNSSPDGWCWKMCQASFPLDLDEEADWTLSQRLPDWIMWDGQALFEQATPERLTAVRDGSASPNLPTPTVNNAKESGTIRDWGGDLTAALLPTPTTVDAKVFGPNVDWQLRLSNHAPHTASVLMNLPSNDGNGSSDDPHQPRPIVEDCDPSSSSG